MDHTHDTPTDYGTGQKKLRIYLIGVLLCVFLTLLSFWTVMTGSFSKAITFTIIYSSAIVQFFVQLLCFLRVTTATEQGKMNVMSFVFTSVILISIIIGSLWIMANLNYNMMH